MDIRLLQWGLPFAERFGLCELIGTSFPSLSLSPSQISSVILVCLQDNSPYDAISFMNSAYLRWMTNRSNLPFPDYAINAGVAVPFPFLTLPYLTCFLSLSLLTFSLILTLPLSSSLSYSRSSYYSPSFSLRTTTP